MLRLLLLMLCAFTLLAQNPNTPKYPGAVASDQDLLVAKDQSASSLSGAIDSTATTIPVADGTRFTGYEVVTVDAEQILVCSVTSNTLNVCTGGRGFAGTIAASHVSGATVRGHITAWHHNQVAAEIKAVQSQLGANLANVVQTGTAYGDPSWISSLSGSKITGDISGNSGGAPWGGVTSRPTTLTDLAASSRIKLSNVGCASAYGSSCDASGNGQIDYADNAGAVGSLGLPSGTTNNEANKVVRTDGNGFANFNYISTTPGDNGSTPIDRVYASNDAFIRSYTMGNFSKQVLTSQPKQINFVYGGSASAFIDNTTVNNVWRRHTHDATITEIACWTDAGTVSLTIKDSAGNAVASALTCSSTGASTAAINGYGAITSGEGLGFSTASASGVKNLSVSIKYAPAY